MVLQCSIKNLFIHCTKCKYNIRIYFNSSELLTGYGDCHCAEVGREREGGMNDAIVLTVPPASLWCETYTTLKHRTLTVILYLSHLDVKTLQFQYN